MNYFMNKCLSLGAGGPYDTNQNFVYQQAIWPYTNNDYVRIFADWRKLAPTGPYAPELDTQSIIPSKYGGNGTTTTPQNYVYWLDQQIQTARSLGLRVLLTFIYHPTWANGQVNNFHIPPDDTSYSSWWNTYLYWCANRYTSQNTEAANLGRYVDILEICNEPNLAVGSLADPFNGDFSEAQKNQWFAPFQAGRKMKTAQMLRQAMGLYSPNLAGPAMYTGGHGDKWGQAANGGQGADTAYVYDLMGYLYSNGVQFQADAYFMWTQHNYGDTGGDHYTTLYTQNVRTALKVKQWKGWPAASANNVVVFQTEGGEKYDQVGGAVQANKMYKAYWNAKTDTPIGSFPSGGEGIAMLTQYLDITSPVFDTGIREVNGNWRPLFYTWKDLPRTP